MSRNLPKAFDSLWKYLPEKEQKIQEEEEIVTHFPLEVYPISLQNLILEAHDTLGYPKDYFAGAILYAASVAVGNNASVELKVGWQESPALFLALVGKPGTNKSSPITFAIKPLLKADKESQERFREEDALYRKQEKDAEALKPTLKKHLVSDFTPEVLAQILQDNPKGIGVYVDELSSWISNFNRYHSGNEEQFWLSTWSQKTLIQDRKSSPSIFVERPFVSVIGGIQPGILGELSKNGRSKNGFLDRILFIIPPILQKMAWSMGDLAPEYVFGYQDFVKNLLLLPERILRFSANAYQSAIDWNKRNTAEANLLENSDLDFYAKLNTYYLRFCILLHCMEEASEGKTMAEIHPDTALKAELLINYFKQNTRTFYKLLDENSPYDNLKGSKKQVYDALPACFTTQKGTTIAELYKMPARTFKRFLNEKTLFLRVNRGEYEKFY